MSCSSQTARPPSPDNAPHAATRVVRLQRLVGNQATARLLQRDNGHAAPTSPAAPAAGPQSTEPPPLDPALRAQLLRASTTLQRVDPLSRADQELLQTAIPGAALFEALRERDAKRRELEERTRMLELARASQRDPPEHGVPASPEEADALGRDVAGLTAEVERLSAVVDDGLVRLGVRSEAELTELLTVRFPARFLERAKQIALAELESNRRMVEGETRRYGLDACVDPAARRSLRNAAAELVERDRALRETAASLQAARSDVDMPSGGVPDPAQMSSSYYDVTRLSRRLEEAGRERDALRRRYALQHPILLRQVDLEAIASGDDARFDAAIGGQLRELVENIDTTRENVASGRLKPWNLRDIVESTSQDMGVTGNAVLEEVVRQHIEREESDEAMVSIALGALALTAGVIATLASGGVALAAGVTAFGIAGYQASESVQTYLAESAAGNVALDPRIADISRREPDLGWLIVDLVAAGLEAAQVVRAVAQLGRAARTARQTGVVVEFEAAARRELPAQAADRVVGSVSRRAAAPASAEDAAHVLQGINDETRAALRQRPRLLELLERNPRAAEILKLCASVCYPIFATEEQIVRLERLLAEAENAGATVDLAAARIRLHAQRTVADLDREIAAMERELRIAAGVRADVAEAGGMVDPALHMPASSVDEGYHLTEQLRRAPGAVHGGERLPVRSGSLLEMMDQGGRSGRIPGQIARRLRAIGHFDSFDHLRETFWRMVAADANLTAGFAPENIARMRAGRPPFVGRVGGVYQGTGGGANRVLQLDHKQAIQHAGGVYDLDNLEIVTPLFHQLIGQ